MSVTVVALHGFLGRPYDWNSVFQHLPAHWQKLAVDYMNENKLGPDISLIEWGNSFHLWLSKQPLHSYKILLGYSLGGRLASHALVNPFFDHTLLISTHPGLASEREKSERLQNDFRWSQRFLHDPWDSLIKDWNSQPVFAGSTLEPKRFEGDYHRSFLAKALTRWSVAHQNRFIRSPSPQVHWLAGEKDLKYCQLLSQVQDGVITIVPSSGHRIHLEQPKFLASYIEELVPPQYLLNH